jgi:transcriptional regulator with XRE-family HTH domain
MKLGLNKQWFEKNIVHDENFEVGAGVPTSDVTGEAPECVPIRNEDEFAESYAFGALVQLLRRDRKLSVEQLAANAQLSASEILNIEFDPKYVPKPRTVFQISKYFSLPDRSLMKLANVTTVHSNKLRDAAVRFAASSSTVMDLSREERAALTEFVQFLVTQEAD